MAVRGLDRIEANLDRWVRVSTDVLGARMGVVAERLKEWARTEYGHVDRSGDLEASIDAYVVEAAANIRRVRLEATMEHAALAELAREGRWAFLWPVLTRHADDIRDILTGGSDGGG